MTEASLSSGPANRRRVCLVFALTAILFTGFFPPSGNPNEVSRIQAIAAFVDHGTFAIDATLKKYGVHEDRSRYDGHDYSNKAPGLIFAGIPIYALLRVFLPEPPDTNAAAFFIVRLLTVSLVSALALARFARRLARPPFRDEHGVAALAVAFGTPFLFFARSLFSHAWTASLLFLAWDQLRSAEEEPGKSERRLALAGFLAGWAVISEYTVAPVVLLLGIRVFAPRRLADLTKFCLGALPPLALLLVYNQICFGAVWSLSSAHEADPLYAASARQGLFGVGPPNLRVVWGYLFGVSRGTILFSPFWLWAIPGFVAWWRSGEDRRDCAFAAAAVALSVLILSGYPHWEGGYSLGSRYLVPLTFLAALGVPFAWRTPWSRWLFAAAASFSIAHFFLLTASWPYIPPSVHWPAANVAWWSLARHWVAQNLGHSLGLTPLWSLAIPGAATAWATWMSLASLLDRSRRAAVTAILAGIAVLALTIAVAPDIAPPEAAWRAWLFQYLQR